MKVLVIQQKMIGDVLLSTLICKNIKIWNPTFKIDFVANRHTLYKDCFQEHLECRSEEHTSELQSQD